MGNCAWNSSGQTSWKEGRLEGPALWVLLQVWSMEGICTCPRNPKDRGDSPQHTSMTSNSLSHLGYEICPAKGSYGRWTGSSSSTRELARGLDLKSMLPLDLPDYRQCLPETRDTQSGPTHSGVWASILTPLPPHLSLERPP